MKTYTTTCRNTFEHIIKKFKSNEDFTFVRFGDGDLFLMFDDRSEAQPDGTIGKWNRFEVTKPLQEELRESFNIKDDNYMVATVMNQQKREIDMGSNNRLVTSYYNAVSKQNFVWRDWFYHHFVFIHSFAHSFNEFKEMVNNYIKPKRIMYVGGYYSDELKNLFGECKYIIETPKENSYSNIEEWYPELLEKSKNVDIVLLATGFSSRVVAKRLWKDNKKLQVLDLGSIVDGLRKDYNRVWLQRYRNSFENNKI